MKKSLKIVSMLMVAIMVMMTSTPVFAGGIKPDQILQGVDATDPSNTQGAKDVMTLVETILGFLQWAAIIGGVLIITILGIKYMMGSLEEKAEYKKSMIPLIVGIVVVMGATSIAKLLFSTFVIGS